MEIITFPTGPLDVNTFIVFSGSECIIIDPGGDVDEITRIIDKGNFKPVMILNTHGHFDHIGAVEELKEKYGIEFHMHGDDKFLLEQANAISAMYGLGAVREPVLDREIEDGQKISLNGEEIEVLHTPGHSPGGVCFYFEKEKALIAGDTIFQYSVGRTDFPYASFETLEASIREKIYTLPDDVTILPGHGPATRVGDEKSGNPFVVA